MSLSTETDLGPLAWVKGEIDLALGRSADALTQAQAGDEAQLKFAQTHLHQAHGALAIVGLDGLTQFSEALEQFVGHIAADPANTQQHVPLALRALAALRQFLDEIAGGAPNQPLRLHPLFADMQVARGQPAPSASELFFPDLMLRPPRREAPANPLPPKQMRLERARYERGLLEVFRGNAQTGLPFMRTAVAAVENAQTLPSTRAFWWVAQGLFDALIAANAPVDDATKKLCARIDGQMRKLAEGSTTVGERLMRDVLYRIAVAPNCTPHVTEIKHTYLLDQLVPNEEASLDVSVLKPRLRALRERIGEAKDAWNRFCAGAAVALPQFHEKIQRLAPDIEALARADFSRLQSALDDTTQWLRKDPLRNSDATSMEVATALLVLENGIEQFGQAASDFPQQSATMLERLAAIQRGETPAEAHAPQIGELAKRAQERLLMAQVAREIQASLGQIEQALDAFFRDTSRNADLGKLDGPLHQVEGALAILGEAKAIGVLREAGTQIREFAELGSLADPAQFEVVAHKLSALGFYVDALQHGNADLDALLSPESRRAVSEAAAMEEELARQVREAQAMAAQLQETPQDDKLRAELKQNLETIRKDASIVADSTLEEHAKSALEVLTAPTEAFDATATNVGRLLANAAPEPAQVAAPSADTTRLAEASTEEIDAELLEIFLLEAHEVLQTIGDNIEPARRDPADREVMTTIRRGFHTLKGSGRMVGLKELGEAAWSVEQVMNRWLQTEQDATPSLLKLVEDARALFTEWVKQLEAGGSTHYDASALLALAERVKEGEDITASAPAAPVVEVEATQPVAAQEEPAAPLVVEDLEEPAEDDTPKHFVETMLGDDLLRVDDEEFTATTAEPLLEDIGFDAIEVTEKPSDAEMIDLEASLANFNLSDLPSLQESDTASLDEPSVFEQAPPPPAQPEPDVVSIDHLQVSRGLLEMFLSEARQHVATLRRELARLQVNPSLMPPEPAVRAAHTLSGIASTLGADAIHDLGRALEGAQARLIRADLVPNADHSSLLNNAASVLEGMVATVAEHHLPVAADPLIVELDRIAALPPKADVVQLRVVTPPFAADVPAEVELPAEAPAAEPEAAEPLAALDAPPPVAEELPEADSLNFVTEASLVAPEPEPEPAAPLEALVEAQPEPVAEAPAAPLAEVVQLAEQVAPAQPIEPEAFVPAAELPTPHDERRKLRLADDLDPQLLPLFLEEADDLMREIGAGLRDWRDEPASPDHPKSLARLLHTLKGSARMAGAMGLGELIHAVESRVEECAAQGDATTAFLDEFETSVDHAGAMIERLRTGEPAQPEAGTAQPQAVQPAGAPLIAAEALEDIESDLVAQRAMVRVRAEAIDRFVNEAGEMSIARTRIEGEMRTLRGSLLDLTENVIRLRNQLREVEIQAESQMQSRKAQAEALHSEFDPLEFDRFTRLQELTRMMAESVNDVTTVQHNLLRNLDAADAALVAQSRLNRDLHQGLMSMRLVPFDSIAERLYRVVRQTAKELGKKVNLDIRGGQLEIDRGVLDKMTAPIEHLLRNSVTHGIEARNVRAVRNKPEIGQIVLAVTQEGNEVAITMTDDGGGLDYDKIRAKGISLGLLQPEQSDDVTALNNLIFAPGFSTAETLSEVAGRGVGMDVVQSETATVGGRIEVRSDSGKGARFAIILPQSTAVTQALLVASAGRTYAIPSSMIEQVMEVKTDALERITNDGGTDWMGNRYPFHYLPRLLGDFASVAEPTRLYSILLLRAGAQRIALRVDGLRGNQEIVLKKTGPQIARVIGVAGATVLGDGEIVLMLNPIALASRDLRGPSGEAPAIARAEPHRIPVVMVVDDSLTVRKISGRLLERAGYQVVTAKDGVDALEQLIDVVPDVMLVDIEMPRMDGFDLTRNVRSDERTRKVPIIMITSRIADKHRNYALEIGVNHYLGKPYQEDELLGLIAGYAPVPERV